jgi:chromosome partitioning protein
MILLCGGEKGGCGKSTLATNLAVYLAHEGNDVVLVDTDSQPTSARFIERRNESGILPAVHCVQRTGDVSAALRDLEKRYQVVVVDAGGRDSKELRTAAAVATLLLTPIKASQADLETLPKVNELVGLARSFNPDLSAYAVLCMAPSNPAIREVAEAKELLSEFDNLYLANTVIRDRKVYRDALLAGRGVVELDNGKAKAEIQLLAQEFFESE